MDSPSPSGCASPPPPPPPPRGWIAGLVSGAGWLLATVLGPDSSISGSTTTAISSDAAAGASLSASSSRPPRAHCKGGNGDHGNSLLFPQKNDQLKQGEKETVLKDYGDGSLAIVSEIDPKDAIVQLLMQDTYSRSECNTLIKIIQERVVDSDSNGVDPGGIARPIAWQTGSQEAAGYSSFNPIESSPATSSLPARESNFGNSVSAGATPTLTRTDQGPFPRITDQIQTVLKRNYSILEDTLDESRRVRPKINGNSFNISKFKQVDVVKNHAGRLVPKLLQQLTIRVAYQHTCILFLAANPLEELSTKDLNASRGFPGYAKKLFSDVPLIGTNNLTYSNIISKGENAEGTVGLLNKPSVVTTWTFGSNSSQACDDRKTYDSTIFNPHPDEVKPLNVFVPFEQNMLDLAQQKHNDSICDGSCSVSKLMFKEDIEASPRSSVGVQLENGSRSRRRRGVNSQRTTTTRSPAKSSHGRNNGIAIKSENDLLEQSKLMLMEQGSDLDHVPVKRPAGRPRKARAG